LPLHDFLDNLAKVMNTSVTMLFSNYIASIGTYNLRLKQDFERWLADEEDTILLDKTLTQTTTSPNNIFETCTETPPKLSINPSQVWSGSHFVFNSDEEDDEEEHCRSKRSISDDNVVIEEEEEKFQRQTKRR
jgi:hypothetical protein